MKFRKKEQPTKTENLAGGQAYKTSTKFELVSLLLTSLVSDKFYESSKEQLQRLKGIVNSLSDKKFIGKAAIYARTEFGMRSITHALLAELSKVVHGEKWIKDAIYKGVYRPDDMLEILGYYESNYPGPIPNQMKKGLRNAIHKFSAYQLAKYKGSKSSVKMVDLFNLVHPTPETDEEKGYFKALMSGDLKNTETWEAKLSSAGQEVKEIKDEAEKEEKLSELKKEAWKNLILNKKIGIFALLRNLRNITEQAPELIDDVIPLLTDEPSIKKSLIFPFRFQTAINELMNVSAPRKLLSAANKALDISVSNVPKYDGKTLIVLDQSGSMNGKPAEIGSLFSAILYKVNDADFMTFSDDARYCTYLNPEDSVSTMTKEIDQHYISGGTNFHAIFEKANKRYDRIIILSDMQGWIGYNTPVSTFNEYKKKYSADPFIYSFDLQGYGTLQFPENKVFAIAGFSDKIFSIMKLLEQDKNALIEKIESIEL